MELTVRSCRQLAPNNFSDIGGYSVVYNQPIDEEEILKTQQAFVSCPTGSIGSKKKIDKKIIREDFPLKLSENVYYCGFNSPKSYGASSYFILDQNGNWLIDSPRYSKYLVEKFKKMGGIKYIFLTHQDDVADATKYQNEFPESRRIIHYYDRRAEPNSEIILKGQETTIYDKLFQIIPTPGHTKGHCVLLYKNKYLFTGDHLYWRRDFQRLRATRSYCWYSWPKLIKSMIKLQDYEFQYILPGHGQRVNLSKNKMKQEMEWLIEQIQMKDYW